MACMGNCARLDARVGGQHVVLLDKPVSAMFEPPESGPLFILHVSISYNDVANYTADYSMASDSVAHPYNRISPYT